MASFSAHKVYACKGDVYAMPDNSAESPPDFEIGVRLTGSEMQINQSLPFFATKIPPLSRQGSHAMESQPGLAIFLHTLRAPERSGRVQRGHVQLSNESSFAVPLQARGRWRRIQVRASEGLP